MNTNRQTAERTKESKMKITTPKVIRCRLSAIRQGLFSRASAIHPPDLLASVNTSSWHHHHLPKVGHVPLAFSALPAYMPGKWKSRVGLVWAAFSCLASSRRSKWALLRRVIAAVGDRGAGICGDLPGISNGAPGEMNLEPS